MRSYLKKTKTKQNKKKRSTKRADGVAQGVGPEFKHQCSSAAKAKKKKQTQSLLK
jgi:hypothetical protein